MGGLLQMLPPRLGCLRWRWPPARLRQLRPRPTASRPVQRKREICEVEQTSAFRIDPQMKSKSRAFGLRLLCLVIYEGVQVSAPLLLQRHVRPASSPHPTHTSVVALSAASTHNPSATTRTFAARFRSSRSRRRWWWARARTTRESQRTAPCRRIHQPNMGRGELTWRQRPGAWSRVTRRLLLLAPFNRHPEQGGGGRGTQGSRTGPITMEWPHAWYDASTLRAGLQHATNTCTARPPVTTQPH